MSEEETTAPDPGLARRIRRDVAIVFATWSTSMMVSTVVVKREGAIAWPMTVSVSLSFLVLTLAALRSGLAGRARAMPVSTLARLAAMGSLGYIFYVGGLYLCIHCFPGGSEPTMLNYTWVFFTALFTDLLGRRLGKKRTGGGNATVAIRFLGMVVGLTGVWLAVSVSSDKQAFAGESGALPAGVLAGLAAGLSYGVFGAYSAHRPSDDEREAMVWLGAGLSAVVMWAGLSAGGVTAAGPSWVALGIAAYFGMICNGVIYLLWTGAIQRAVAGGMPICRVTSPMYALPVASLLVTSAFLGERAIFRPAFLAGAALLTVGMILVQKAEWVASPARR